MAVGTPGGLLLGLLIFETFCGGVLKLLSEEGTQVTCCPRHVWGEPLIGGPGAPMLWGAVAPPRKRLGLATPQSKRHNRPHGRFGRVTCAEFPSRPESAATLPAPPRPLSSGVHGKADSGLNFHSRPLVS